MHGRRLRRHYGERRAGGDVVHVEAAPGVVMVVAAWMLDAAACADMDVGPPRVAASALADLHRLLTALGFRTDSQDDSNVVQRSTDETNTTGFAAVRTPARDGAGRQEAVGDE